MANIYIELGILYLTKKDNQKAIDSYNKAINIKKDLYKENEDIAQLYSTIGDIYLITNDLKSAKAMYENGLKMQKKVASGNNQSIQILESKYKETLKKLEQK